MNVHLLEEKDLEKAYQIYEECFERKIFNHSYNMRENVHGLYLDNKLIGKDIMDDNNKMPILFITNNGKVVDYTTDIEKNKIKEFLIKNKIIS